MASMQGHNPEKLSQGETNATELIFSTANSIWQWVKSQFAGEIHADGVGGFLQVAGTGADFDCPGTELLTTDYTPYATNGQLILGFDYMGGGGDLWVVTFAGNTKRVPLPNTAVYGIRTITCQFQKIYAMNDDLYSGYTPAFDAADELLCYLTRDTRPAEEN